MTRNAGEETAPTDTQMLASRNSILGHHGVQLCPMSGNRSEQETRLEVTTATLAK